MNKFALMVWIAALVVISGCNKSLSVNDTIVGKWILTSYYMDPGNGSGKWQNADHSNPEYLEFQPDGSLEGNRGLPQNYNRYKVLNDSVLQFSSTITVNVIEAKYVFMPDSLAIYPPCIEGCGFRYKTAR